MQKIKFGEIFKYEQPTNYIIKKPISSTGLHPVLTANKSFILGYTDEANTFNNPAIIFDDFTLDCKYIDIPFMVKSSALKILTTKNNFNLYYMFYRLKTTKFVKNGHGRHFLQYVSNYTTHIHSIEEQHKIGSFFKELDELIELEKKYLKNLFNITKYFQYKYFYFDSNKKTVRISEVMKIRNEKIIPNNLEHLSLSKNGVHPKLKQYNRDFITKNKKNKVYKITKINDICYNPANLKFGVICRNKYGLGYFSPIYETLICENIHPIYAEYLVTSNNFIRRVRKFEEGTITERIAVKIQDFMNTKINLHSKEKQIEIAQIFKIIEDLQNLQKIKVKRLEDIKKYFLQTMFC